jgi:hypothetical protein
LCHTNYWHFGAAAPYAVAAGVASAGLSLFFVYEALEDYNRQNAANDTGLLSNDPSLVWVMLAIAGAAVDVAALHSAFKAANKIAEAATEFKAALDDKAVLALEQKLAKIAALDARIQKNIVKQARIQAQQQKLLSSMVAARGVLTVTIPGLAQTGELVARAVFAIRKGAVSLDTFIAELKAAKLIADTGLTPEELLLVKDAFTRARKLAVDEKWVAELEKAMSEGDWVRVKGLIFRAEIEKLWPPTIPKAPVDDLSKIKNGCEDVAKEIHSAIGGDFLEITNPISFRGNSLQLGPVKGQSLGWYDHVAVIKNGIVFDRLTGVYGMELSKYKLLFEYGTDLKFEIVIKSKFIK